jgi:hypothetical protein
MKAMMAHGKDPQPPADHPPQADHPICRMLETARMSFLRGQASASAAQIIPDNLLEMYSIKYYNSNRGKDVRRQRRS